MKGYILMPTIMKKLGHCLTDMFMQLFRSVEHLGFEIGYADSLAGLPANADVVIIFGGVHGKQMIYDAVRLPRHIKVVLYLQAIHGFTRSVANEEAMQRFTYVLSGAYDMFKKKWPEYMKKLVLFPNYFAPHDRYVSLLPYAIPDMKCLLSGHVSLKTYPLRNFIMAQLQGNSALQKIMVRMRHPRWDATDATLQYYEIAPVLNEAYAQALNDHYCAVATSSVFKYVLAKYFEIPAAGALLLAERTPDSDTIGFKPRVHYVPIDRANVVAQVSECVRSPEKFEKIRLAGCAYVRAQHSMRNRTAQLKELINEL